MEQGKKRYNIGVLIGNAHSNHPKELIYGIHQAAGEEKVDVIFFLGTQSCYFYKDVLGDSKENKNYDYQFNIIYDYAGLGDVDALIISYGSLSIFLEVMDKNYFLNRFQGIPYIMLEDETEDENIYMIIDNYQGMSECVEHLIKVHNYRNIVYVSGPEGNQDAMERLKAYRDTMGKYGITVTSQMVVYGDYSEFVDEKVDWLFDNNEKIDAIVFANDEMATAGYRVCKKRGLKVGVDIAITGFDDINLAETMDPPLTTVTQNGYEMGYLALKDIVRICRNEEVNSRRIQAQFCIRGSCGCFSEQRFSFRDDEAYGFEKLIEKAAYDIAGRIMIVRENNTLFESTRKTVKEFLEYFYHVFLVSGDEALPYEKRKVMDMLRPLLGNKFISSMLLKRQLSSFIKSMMDLLKDSYDKNRAYEMIYSLQEYINSDEIMRKEDEYALFQRRTWFMNFLTRDMMEHVEDEQKIFADAMEKLAMMNTKSAYLYLFSVPRIHRKGEEWYCPRTLYLAASHENGVVTSYKPEERPDIDRENGFMQFMQKDRIHRLTALTLFSGEKQYGILLAEINPEDVAFLYVTSLQIGTILRFQEENALERRIKGQLELSYNIIREKNEVLNFISEYDELTKLYNRRGFMEQCMSRIKRREGETAYLIFGDLDHLKEINDSFGHSEGDFSIIRGGMYLKDNLSDEALVGRIGGDEFIAMDFAQPEDFSEEFPKRMKAVQESFNEKSEKPYNVEISIGMIEFTCSHKVDLTEMIKRADEVLYEAKKLRKKSIKKNN